MIRKHLVTVTENLAPTPIAWIAIVVGVFVHFAGFFLFKVEVPRLSIADNPDAYISYVDLQEGSGNAELRERSLLSDSVPLFLPSEFDYGWEMMQPSYYVEDRNARMLVEVEHNFSVDANAMIATPFPVNNTPALTDLLAPELWNVYETLGEKRSAPMILNKRFGWVQFRDEMSGGNVYEVEIEESPVSSNVEGLFWKPCEVLVHVGPEGCIGKPRISVSSGFVTIDQWIANWIQVRSNQRVVSPGYYRVVFGP